MSKKTNAEQSARDTLSAVVWLHTTLRDKVFLWRGQADDQYGVEPGAHTRALSSIAGAKQDLRTGAKQALVDQCVERLLLDARNIGLDRHQGVRLPDLALLAKLQHHGAATPLLDVSTDPMIALWMAAFANPKEPAELDDRKGSLFAILRPPENQWIAPMDARPFASGITPSVSTALDGQTWWYRAPDVTERLRIQRGSFLVGPLSDAADRSDTTLPLNLAKGKKNSIADRLDKRGSASNGNIGQVEIFKFVIAAASKKHLRTMLEDRSGLSVDEVFPTPWGEPFVEQFSKAYGRDRALDLDVPEVSVAAAKTPPIGSNHVES